MEPVNHVYKRVSPFWTIWLPLGLGLVIILGAFALILVSSSTGSAQVSLWAQISTTFIAFLLILAGLVQLALILISVVGVQKVAVRMPGWLAQARIFSLVNLAKVRCFSSIIAKPMLVVLTGFSGLKSAWNLLIIKINKQVP